MTCRCEEVEELRDHEAVEYAERHLERVASQPGGQWLYQCPTTRSFWIYDSVREWDTGHGGHPRLRRVQLQDLDT
jgi:hypothetical protein